MYTWPGLMKQCQEVIGGCVDCMKVKEKLVTLPLKPTFKFTKPFECWSIDYMPQLPLTDSGYSHLLVCVCSFSKWVELFPMVSKSSTEVWNTLYDHLFSRFGQPLELRCDRGTEFGGTLKRKCELFGINLVKISVQNPQANGQAERYVQVVKRSLKTILSQYDWRMSDWLLCLPAILIGLRFYYHSVLGVSPYFVCFGREPRLPIKHHVSGEVGYSYDESEVELYVDE